MIELIWVTDPKYIADSKALAALLACRQALEGADETKRPRLVAALSSDTAQQTA